MFPFKLKSDEAGWLWQMGIQQDLLISRHPQKENQDSAWLILQMPSP